MGEIIVESNSVLFTSSVLNLAELVALRPDFLPLKKILYFHENQLIYPVRRQLNRDFQYGYNQILSCLVADQVLFNSKYNMESFLSSIDQFLKLIPDHRPVGLANKIRSKCEVLYFPLDWKHSFKGKLSALPASSIDHSTIESTSNAENVYESKLKKPNKDLVQELAINHRVVNDKSRRCYNNEKPVCLSDEQISLVNPGFECDKSCDSVTVCDESCLDRQDSCSIYPSTCVNLKQQYPPKKWLGDNSLDRERCETDVPVQKCDSPSEECCEDGIEDIKETFGSVSSPNDFVPLLLPSIKEVPALETKKKDNVTEPLHILWPHRWEHDKGPDSFFQVLFQLHEENLPFTVSVLGESFSQIPDIFDEAKKKLHSHIVNWGYAASREKYIEILQKADVSVSTAKHEFFGVAMIESTLSGCYPVCPNRLVYPEIFPGECLYNTDNQLFKKLRGWCKQPVIIRKKSIEFGLERFLWCNLKSEYRKVLYNVCSE